MECPKCGNYYPDDTIYCWECGTKLVKTTTDTIKTQIPKYEKTITCPNCEKTFQKESSTYEKYNMCPHCLYNFITLNIPQPEEQKIIRKALKRGERIDKEQEIYVKHKKDKKEKNRERLRKEQKRTSQEEQENLLQEEEGHIWEIHLQEQERQETYEKTITCPNCKKTFQKESFTYKNRCPHCQYNFKTGKVHDSQIYRIKPTTSTEKPVIPTNISKDYSKLYKCLDCGNLLYLKDREDGSGEFYQCEKCYVIYNYEYVQKFAEKYTGSRFVLDTCPRCGGIIIPKTGGPKGEFYGCVNYPSCDFAYSALLRDEIDPVEEMVDKCDFAYSALLRENSNILKKPHQEIMEENPPKKEKLEKENQEPYEKNPPNETSFIDQLITENKSTEYIIEEPYKTKDFITDEDEKNIETYNKHLKKIAKINRQKRF